ncbi:Valine--tRNA ligase [Nitrincola nitratireducens]|uniref:Valine--tRNA ligase n=1 Tax=Nitrincola nitratireducens TaxID=1229521 RepID=W9V7N8_9GAMM|nr:Valine--tRNA ligase [Nitrincola nitratireducens]
MMPYITEEIWQKVGPLAGKTGDTLMLQPYPIAEPHKIDSQASSDIEWLKGVMLAIRNIRGEMNIGPGKAISVLLRNTDAEDERRLKATESLLIKLAKLDSIERLATDADAPMSATGLVGAMEILVPMAGLIDKDAELARLNKEVDKLNKEIERLAGKLSNEGFVSKAPAEVVAKEKDKLADMQAACSRLSEQKASIEAM